MKHTIINIMRTGHRKFLKVIMASLLTIFISTCAKLPESSLPTTLPLETPTPLPSPTIDWFPRTPTPTRTPFSTPTTNSTTFINPESIGELLIEDNFNNNSNWTTTKNEMGNVVYGDQLLSLAVSGDKGNLNSVSQHNIPADFYLTINVQVALCSPGDQYGVSFWRQESGANHRLIISCEGNYRFERFTGSSGLVLRDWETASKMMPGSPALHSIGIWARQGEIQVFINETYQFSINTLQNQAGGLAVFARAGGNIAMTVGFSELKVFKVLEIP